MWAEQTEVDRVVGRLAAHRAVLGPEGRARGRIRCRLTACSGPRVDRGEGVTAAVEDEAAAERAVGDPDPQLVEHRAAGDLPELALIDAADLDAPVPAVRLPVAHAPGQSAGRVGDVVGEQPHGSRERRSLGDARHRRAERERHRRAGRQQLRRRPRSRADAERDDRGEQTQRAAAPPPSAMGRPHDGDLTFRGLLELAAQPLQRRLVRHHRPSWSRVRKVRRPRLTRCRITLSEHASRSASSA